jgi:lysozyme family protein
MATFEAALPVIHEHEGGKGKLPGDPGGETNFGVSSALCKSIGKPLPQTREEADEIFREVFWSPLFNKIVNQTFATKLVDDCINQGIDEAVTILQESMCSVGSIVAVDGKFGTATLTGLNYIPETKLLNPWRQRQYRSYSDWIGKNPAEREGLRFGLARRAAWPSQDDSIAQLLIKHLPGS